MTLLGLTGPESNCTSQCEIRPRALLDAYSKARPQSTELNTHAVPYGHKYLLKEMLSNISLHPLSSFSSQFYKGCPAATCGPAPCRTHGRCPTSRCCPTAADGGTAPAGKRGETERADSERDLLGSTKPAAGLLCKTATAGGNTPCSPQRRGPAMRGARPHRSSRCRGARLEVGTDPEHVHQ